MMTHLKRTIALYVLQPTQTVDQMKRGFNALHVKSGPTKSAWIFCIQGHLFDEIVIQTTQILIINWLHAITELYDKHCMKSEFLCSLWQRKESFMPLYGQL